MSDICRIEQAFLDAIKHIEGAESLELKTNQDVQCANGKLYSVWFDSAEARQHDTVIYTRKEPTVDHSIAVQHLKHALNGSDNNIKNQRSYGDEGTQHVTVAPEECFT